MLQVDCKGNSITIYYHPNSLRFTQSVRVAEANSWRFTVTLDTPEASYAWLPHGRGCTALLPSIFSCHGLAAGPVHLHLQMPAAATAQCCTGRLLCSLLIGRHAKHPDLLQLSLQQLP